MTQQAISLWVFSESTDYNSPSRLFTFSLQPLWQVNPTALARWSDRTELFFNGSLVISDPHSELFWSTGTLGDTFMALYAKFEENTQQMYWKRKALEARAVIVEGQGPILSRVESSGFLVRLESDGNLKGYFWDGSTWALDYQAISAMCDLPSPCGSYGLCKPGSGCSCLDNRTEFSSGECLAVQSGDLCSNGETKTKNDFRVLRRKGVDLPFKELMGYKTVSSLEHCEGLCENNCSCWGAVYNNASGFCYLVDYPIRTLLAVGDETKAGIWKRRRGVKRILVEEDGISPGPYKDLGSASFRSIEMDVDCGAEVMELENERYNLRPLIRHCTLDLIPPRMGTHHWNIIDTGIFSELHPTFGEFQVASSISGDKLQIGLGEL
ncbi:hypothetical protein GH714_038500 [Hevea brasiliensis]|uniref:Apple domain-containing protein n=1 Tax=Hevea brasiliensis TaxID=3981 RepID=A0A6A6KQP0_HEVBR|nr:hypothetical protein GH714_038500 [Hevea brasiliensis]